MSAAQLPREWPAVYRWLERALINYTYLNSKLSGVFGGITTRWVKNSSVIVIDYVMLSLMMSAVWPRPRLVGITDGHRIEKRYRKLLSHKANGRLLMEIFELGFCESDIAIKSVDTDVWIIFSLLSF